ncbi:MAG TPA: hypothetical protein VK993_00465 [Chthoniobacterales bacterium]|nr:hypothetical protein [Chthoniobacterales bacterium]
MTFLFILLFSLGLFHWAYESAVAPSLRLGARYKLFRIRDELRNLAATKGVVLNRKAIRLFEESLNSTLAHMRDFDFAFALAVNKRNSTDESFRRRLEHRVMLITEYQDPDFVRLRKRYEHVFREINLINVGGWFVYLVPIVAAAVCWGALRRLFLLISVVPDTDVHTFTSTDVERCAAEQLV